MLPHDDFEEDDEPPPLWVSIAVGILIAIALMLALAGMVEFTAAAFKSKP